ncbi:hypothetical protein MKK67_19555 [Methylobacterium sp. J-072]|uniref:hypothetical protein n=1 Tax=Methylobacterium sp. J-072 TaxID=2836651 RepID=UPI001FB8C528|nr:hypothetical protein [Methylobacterium sp. J-072]MCJ2094674.1 hypothetical protein [Methylobacterium sp. J-072]
MQEKTAFCVDRILSPARRQHEDNRISNNPTPNLPIRQIRIGNYRYRIGIPVDTGQAISMYDDY